MGQNKAILGYFLANVHKRRNCNSYNTSDLPFGSKKRSIFFTFSMTFLKFYERKYANRTYIVTCDFADFWKIENYMYSQLLLLKTPYF